jgi:hypothetical protein
LTIEKDITPYVLLVLKFVEKEIRSRWPNTTVIIRGDSGFCREELMAFFEENAGFYYVFGLPKNKRLIRAIGGSLERVEKAYQKNKRAHREYRELRYRTRKSWSRARRVVAKAEHLEKGANPRFCGDEHRSYLVAGAKAVRETLLRARQHGEPDQGAKARFVFRPGFDAPPADEPAQAVVLKFRVFIRGRAETDGVGRHRPGHGVPSDDSLKAPQGRGSGERQPAPRRHPATTIVSLLGLLEASASKASHRVRPNDKRPEKENAGEVYPENAAEANNRR